MSARTLVVSVLLATTFVASACAKRLDARTRRGFRSGAASDQAGTPGGDEVPGSGGTGPRDTPAVYGWDRVTAMIDDAVAFMRRSPDDDAMARLAQRWCDGNGEVHDTDDGPVRTCEPSPPVIVDNVRFTLELGAPGVIGLVATDLSAADSERVAARAKRTAERWCTAPWITVSDDDAHRSQDLATCPIAGGPTLAVGRFAQDRGGTRWQVSVAVVGAS